MQLERPDQQPRQGRRKDQRMAFRIGGAGVVSAHHAPRATRRAARSRENWTDRASKASAAMPGS